MLNLARHAPVYVLNATVPRAGLTVTHDVAFGDLPRQKLDIYRPLHGADLPVIIYFYGGSWRTGSKAIYPFVAATMARAGAVVVVPNYRLYPDVVYPAFLQDCARAVAWATLHRSQLGSEGPLFLMGHSAGAYNTMMLGLDPTWLRQAGAGNTPIAGLIGLAGPYDFLPITNPEIQPVFPNPEPSTQPINHIQARSQARTPPLLLLTGSDDRQVKPRNTQALASKIASAGGTVTTHTYPELGHIGLITAIAPIFQWRAPVLRDVMGFVDGKMPFQPPSGVPKPPNPAT